MKIGPGRGSPQIFALEVVEHQGAALATLPGLPLVSEGACIKEHSGLDRTVTARLHLSHKVVAQDAVLGVQ